MKIFSFTQGIEQILSSDLPDNIQLPGSTQPILPSPEQFRHQLDRIITTQSLEAGLTASMQPEIADPQILVPFRFNNLFASIVETLDSLSGKNDLPAEMQTAMKNLGQLLGDEHELRDLLHMYQHILHQG